MALPITRYINRISKYTNKLSMTILALIIAVLLLADRFRDGTWDNILLFVWILFLILSFFFALNGFLLVYVFNKEISYYRQQGKPIRGLQGFDELKNSLYKSRFESIFITFASILAFTLHFLTDKKFINVGNFGPTLSVTMIFIAISIMFLVEYPDDPSFTPGGLIGYYEPDVFPLVLDNLLNDVFVTYVDPATFLKVDEWSNTILELLKAEYESDEKQIVRLERAREKILLLAYLSYSNKEAFSEDTINRELKELFGETNINAFKLGISSGLTWIEVQDIIKRIEQRAPEPFRLVDRLMVQLVDNYESFTNQDIYFTVSAKSNQGSVTESTGIIVFFLNNTPRDDRSVFVRLDTDEYSIHPAKQELSLKLDKTTDPYPTIQPPLVGEGEDILTLLSSALQVGDAVWFRIQPTGFGSRVVSIKANEEGSNFAFGRTFEMKFTKSIGWYFKTFAPKLSALGSVALPVIRASLSL